MNPRISGIWDQLIDQPELDMLRHRLQSHKGVCDNSGAFIGFSRTTSPSLRASTGILKPNSRMLLHMHQCPL
jgi:hypothetical protein